MPTKSNASRYLRQSTQCSPHESSPARCVLSVTTSIICIRPNKYLIPIAAEFLCVIQRDVGIVQHGVAAEVAVVTESDAYR